MEGILFQTSLIAAFVAGVVALFAPCCITFLLPAYLGSVFREKEKVLLMTLVFGAGIFAVLLPAVLGIAAISSFLFDNHDKVFILGAIVMLIVSVVAFLGLKFPMPRFTAPDKKRPDVLSVFTLGIFSGITSACCAPVLIGVLTLTFLSPSFFGALSIGAMYVLGMITPLLLISIFLDGKLSNVTVLRKSLFQLNLFGKKYTVMTGNLIASAVFFFTGILILILTMQGKLAMGNVDGFTKLVQNSAMFISRYIGGNIIINIIFGVLILAFLYWIAKKVSKGKKDNSCCEKEEMEKSNMHKKNSEKDSKKEM